MKKKYEALDINVLFLYTQDVITSSVTDSSDNVGDLPEFPEFMG